MRVIKKSLSFLTLFTFLCIGILSVYAECNQVKTVNHGPNSCVEDQYLSLDQCRQRQQNCIQDCFFSCRDIPIDCGNGIVDPGEECDDGNTNDDDYCSNSCTINPICGDGIVEGDEECDDGNGIDYDLCSNTCEINQYAYCGNGNVEYWEDCDDGNNIDDDECPNNCQIGPICGNGIVEEGEQCDDGNNDENDDCNNECQLNPNCGNGNTDPGEECDDGNQINYDFCTNSCKDNYIYNPPAPPQAAFCNELPTPSAIWRLDGNMNDSSSNNNVGISLSENYKPGRFGQAHESYGDEFQGVNINDHSSIEAGSGNFSISMWFKTQENSFILIKKGADAINGYKFFYEFGNLVIRFENYDDINVIEYKTYLPNLNDGGWHHIVFTMDRSKEDGGRVYYDGFPSPMTPSSWLDQYAFDPTLFPQGVHNQEDLHIGGNSFESMIGLQDHVIFFKKALSYSQARALFEDSCFTQEENMGTSTCSVIISDDITSVNYKSSLWIMSCILIVMLFIARRINRYIR